MTPKRSSDASLSGGTARDTLRAERVDDPGAQRNCYNRPPIETLSYKTFDYPWFLWLIVQTMSPPPVVLTKYVQVPPHNHRTLIGANVACFRDNGEYAGYNGEVCCVHYSGYVATDKFASQISYEISVGPNVHQRWSPLKLFRESYGALCVDVCFISRWCVTADSSDGYF